MPERGTFMGMRFLVPLRGVMLSVALGLGLTCVAGTAWAQGVIAPSNEPVKPHRIHLILKDGSYQLVTSYQVVGKVVRYSSAERAGETEEIPVELVDLNATRQWEKAHTQATADDSGNGQNAGRQAPQIDPELLKEEEERTSLTPMIAPNLRLPELNSVLALDTWQGEPELVPLMQSAGDLNRSTSHNVLRQALNPLAAQHQLLVLKGTRSYIQVHVDTPVFYIRVGDDVAVPTGGTPLTVDTHGASQRVGDAKADSSGGSATSRYVIVHADVRTDARVIASFRTSVFSGDVQKQEDIVETHSELMRGGHWMKLTPVEPLGFGEYALVEVISDKEVNLGVWDFGVHPTAPENRDVVHPEVPRPGELERRKSD
jgi:hypothetical protein